MNNDFWMRGFDLASIATWLMIIGFAVLLYIGKTSKRGKSSGHTPKK